VLDISGASPKEMAWYQKLQTKLGLSSAEEAVIYHAAMYHAKAMEFSKEDQAGMFGKESPENRKILLGILEKLIEGEDLPEF